MTIQQIKKRILIVFTILFAGGVLSAEEFKHEKIISFEKGAPKSWSASKGGKLTVSNDHYKHGAHSLEWNWKKPGIVTINQNIGFHPYDPEAEEKSLHSFVVWIYNEKPVEDHLKFVFGTGEEDNCSFNFNLNFKGWRTAWVSFERDMEGTPNPSMNQLRIEGPRSITKGRLFFDHVLLSTPIDSRHHTADHQVPLVNKKTTSHWLILEESSRKVPDISQPSSISQDDIQGFKSIEQKYTEDILKKTKVNNTYVDKLEKEYGKYHIVRTKSGIKGDPIWFKRHAELYIPLSDRTVYTNFGKGNHETRSYFDFMLKVAGSWYQANETEHKDKLGQMFLDLFDHIEDQGFAAYSGTGTIHHYGYSWRSYYSALYLMKGLLQETGRLERAVKGLQWFSALGEVFEKPEKPGMSMDAFNTTVMGRLGSILIMEDSPVKSQYLQCFSRWIDNGLQHAKGLDGAFKIDGSMYHHCNNYPAYATGGLTGATRMVYFLSRTPYKVSQQGHENIKKSLLMMRLYCNHTEWPVSMSGRHPMKKGWSLTPEHFSIMTLAGSPDGVSKYDKEMAQAYLRIIGNEKANKYGQKVKALGVEAEQTPNGNWVMSYASISIHRRDDWTAVVRGHSRYLWAAEHYIGANYYGRYMAHGSLQVNHLGNPISSKSSGWVQQGWDWNRFPGTTTIHQPLDRLRANILNVDQFSGLEEMLYSDEAFAGGISMGKNGVYAFKLHEHDKYEGSHRARKSFFFFDNRIICLGTDIENDQDQFPTETTLFQASLKQKNDAIVHNGESINVFPYQKEITTTNSWIIDNTGIGYYLPNGQNIQIRKAEQHSRDQAKETPTKGNFASAVIEHGKAPKNAKYEYAMVVKATPGEMDLFAGNMQEDNNAPYRVLQQNKKAHIIWERQNNCFAYVLFEGDQKPEKGPVKSANIPCMIMASENNDQLSLSVCDPDLRLYEGPADCLYDENGKRVERSIYSRPWIHNESKPSVVEVELGGNWKIASSDTIESEILSNGNTLLKIICKDGLSQELNLYKN